MRLRALSALRVPRGPTARRAASGWATAQGQSDEDGSKFENYHEAAQVYDNIRYAGGVEVTLGAFAQGTSAPLHRQRVLDVGCGTGNYAAALAPHVAELACFDGNASMLAKCKEKLNQLGAAGGGAATTATFAQGLLPALPFDDCSFDSAMCNVVVHHIEDDETRPTWARTAATVAEVARVLRPGGTFCLNHVAPEQLDSYWFLHYVPECRERWRATLVPQQQLVDIFEGAGLTDVRRTTPLDYVLFRPLATYLQRDGPLNPEWRKSTSMWAVGEAAELEHGLKQLETDIASGAIDGILSDYEARRRELGHTMFFYGNA